MSLKKPTKPTTQHITKPRRPSPADDEWNANIKKLRSTWSRIKLSQEDIDTIYKIVAKLP